MELQYDKESVHAILKDIYLMANYKIAIFDSNFNEVFGYPSVLTNFCKHIREKAEVNSRCLLCDNNAHIKCMRTKKPYVYECHMGLTEIIIPIISSNLIIGYIMAGQFCNQNSATATWKKMYSHLENLGYAPEDLREEYQKIVQVDDNQISAITNLLLVISRHFVTENKVATEETSMAQKINNLILENMHQDINIDYFCCEFMMKKTNFCKMAKSLFGIGIMEHVRVSRIQTAKKLLETTDLPINEVADRVGISDYNYFTKVFKKQVLLTPREYRKNFRVI